MKFHKAARQKLKASIMIEGLQGSGKSGLALLIAKALTDDWSKIYAIDTENRSLDLFEGLKMNTGDSFGSFNKVDLTIEDGYAPSNYLALRDEAIKEGAEVVVMDSISHMWNRKGGLLDLVAEAQANGLDNYRSWGTERNRREKELLNDIVRSKDVHVITTVRIKEKFGMEYDETKGKTTVVSLGEQQIQQADLKYEPDLVLHMLKAGKNKNGVVSHPVAKVIKSRYAIFDEGEEYEFTPALIEQLRKYLDEGIDPTELLEQQRQDYIAAVTEYLNEHPNAKNIWKVLKADAGYKDTKLTEMPLDAIKHIYIKLID